MEAEEGVREDEGGVMRPFSELSEESMSRVSRWVSKSVGWIWVTR